MESSQSSFKVQSKKPIGYIKEFINGQVGKAYCLYGPKAHMGRNPHAEVPVPCCNVSRTHAILNSTKKGWTIVDNKSINGVYVDGAKLTPSVPRLLRNGQYIHLGPPSAALKFQFFTAVEDEANSSQTLLQYQSIDDLIANHDIEEINCDGSALSTQQHTGEKHTVGKQSSEVEQVLHAMKGCTPGEYNVCDNFYSQISHEVSLEQRIAAIDSQLRKSDALHERVQRILNRSDESLTNVGSPSFIRVHNASPPEEERKQETRTEFSDSEFRFHDDDAFNGVLPLIVRIQRRESDSGEVKNIQTDGGEVKVLKEKVAELEKQIQERDQIKVNLEKKLEEKDALLEDQHQHKKMRKDDEHGSSQVATTSENSIKEEVAKQFGTLMETELTCSICTELFVKATTLECSHTFCNSCITQWKKTRKECPICRKRITREETKSLVIDNFIDKMVENLSPEFQSRRKAVVDERAAAAVKKPSPPGRKKKATTNSRRRGTVTPVSLGGMGPYINVNPATFANIDVLYSSPPITPITVEINSEMSDDSSGSEDGYSYYGGYGRCYNCGRRGHWANGCPDF